MRFHFSCVYMVLLCKAVVSSGQQNDAQVTTEPDVLATTSTATTPTKETPLLNISPAGSDPPNFSSQGPLLTGDTTDIPDEYTDSTDKNDTSSSQTFTEVTVTTIDPSEEMSTLLAVEHPMPMNETDDDSNSTSSIPVFDTTDTTELVIDISENTMHAQNSSIYPNNSSSTTGAVTTLQLNNSYPEENSTLLGNQSAPDFYVDELSTTEGFPVTSTKNESGLASSQTGILIHPLLNTDDIITITLHPQMSVMTWIWQHDSKFRKNLAEIISDYDSEDNHRMCPVSSKNIMYVSPTPLLVEDSIVISLIVRCNETYRLPGSLLYKLITSSNNSIEEQITVNVTSVVRGKPDFHVSIHGDHEDFFTSHAHLLAMIVIVAIIALCIVCVAFVFTRCRSSKESWDPIAFGQKYQVDGKTRHIPEDVGLNLATDTDCVEGETLKSKYHNGRYPDIEHDNWVFPAENHNHNGVKSRQEDTKL